MHVFVDKRSKNAIIKRMIELGLIAERSEILPSKRKRARKSQSNTEGDGSGSGSGSDSEASDDSDNSDMHDSRPVRVTIKTTKKAKEKPSTSKQQPGRQLPKIMINAAEIKRQVAEMDENLKVHFGWIQESLNDAAEDVDENDESSDPSDAVPIVPFSMAQKEALESVQLKKLFHALGLQEPVLGMVS